MIESANKRLNLLASIPRHISTNKMSQNISYQNLASAETGSATTLSRSGAKHERGRGDFDFEKGKQSHKQETTEPYAQPFRN